MLLILDKLSDRDLYIKNFSWGVSSEQKNKTFLLN